MLEHKKCFDIIDARCKHEHSISVIETRQILLYTKIIFICPENSTKHIKCVDRILNIFILNHGDM